MSTHHGTGKTVENLRTHSFWESTALALELDLDAVLNPCLKHGQDTLTAEGSSKVRQCMLWVSLCLRLKLDNLHMHACV